MPAKQTRRGDAAQAGARFTAEQIQQHRAVAAISSPWAGGPPIPPRPPRWTRQARTSRWAQQLFIANCAQCHNFAGAGGALTYGKYAPALTHSTPTQIYEAMLTGPEAMPVFSDTTVTPQPRSATSSRTSPSVRAEPNPGGFSLGRVGPVTEGLVAFLGWVRRPGVRRDLDYAKRREGMSEMQGSGEQFPPGDGAEELPESRAPHRVIGTPAARPGQDPAGGAAAGRAAGAERGSRPSRPTWARRRRAERVVAALFILSMLASIGFIAAYVGLEVHSVGRHAALQPGAGPVDVGGLPGAWRSARSSGSGT